MQPNYNGISNTTCITIDDSFTVSVFGGIHGNEKSGPEAIQLFLNYVKTDKIKLKKGKIIFVEKANEEALKVNKREIKKNMNRLFTGKLEGEDYESKRAFQLSKILDEVDYHLDLHSTSGKSVPFLFAEKNAFSFAKKLGISNIVVGWGELGNDIIAGDTENYVNNKGKIGLTFEAGNHDDNTAIQNAYQAILNFLSVLGVIDKKYFKNIGSENLYTQIEKVYIAQTNNFKYLVDVYNFQKLKKGLVLAKDGNDFIRIQNDSVLILPKKENIIKPGIEAFFLGKKI